MAETVKTKKEGRAKKTARFFKQIRLELKKVVWPTRQQLITSTISVVIFCLLIGAIITVLDWVVGKLIIEGLLRLAIKNG